MDVAPNTKEEYTLSTPAFYGVASKTALKTEMQPEYIEGKRAAKRK